MRKSASIVTAAAAFALCSAGAASASGQPATHPIALRNTSGVPTATTGDIAPALRALHIRGQAMNERYHLGSASVTVPGGFDWSAFGVGAGAMLGFVLVTVGLTNAERVARELNRSATPGRG